MAVEKCQRRKARLEMEWRPPVHHAVLSHSDPTPSAGLHEQQVTHRACCTPYDNMHMESTRLHTAGPRCLSYPECCCHRSISTACKTGRCMQGSQSTATFRNWICVAPAQGACSRHPSHSSLQCCPPCGDGRVHAVLLIQQRNRVLCLRSQSINIAAQCASSVTACCSQQRMRRACVAAHPLQALK
jgi:hypothetical protein